MKLGRYNILFGSYLIDFVHFGSFLGGYFGLYFDFEILKYNFWTKCDNLLGVSTLEKSLFEAYLIDFGEPFYLYLTYS